MFAHRACPACEHNAARELGQKNGFTLVSCRACGTAYTSVLPRRVEALDYDAYYSTANLTPPAVVLRRIDEIVAGFSPYRQNNRLLDVGFGAGSLLEAAARAGWVVHGVEVSRTASEHMQRLGGKLFYGELAEAKYAAGYFDVVTASEVLEHAPDALAMLQEIGRILRPGGLLWATTPHGRGLSAQLLGVKWSVVAPPEHLQLFSLRGMKALLRRAGFRRAKLLTHAVNPFEIVSVLRGGTVSDGQCGAPGEGGFDRVNSSYQLNALLSESRTRQRLKEALNGALNATRLGDSLKIYAQR